MAENFTKGEFPVLFTTRLTLRQLKLSDAKDVLTFRGDPEVQKYNDVPLRSEEEAIHFVEEQNQLFDQGESISWAMVLKETGKVIGIVGFGSWNRWHRWAEVGFDLRKSEWGKGFASESVKAILNFGFGKLNLNRVEAYTVADNHLALKLLERLGFIREGLRRSRILEDDGAFHDSAVYGLLAEEFHTKNG